MRSLHLPVLLPVLLGVSAPAGCTVASADADTDELDTDTITVRRFGRSCTPGEEVAYTMPGDGLVMNITVVGTAAVEDSGDTVYRTFTRPWDGWYQEDDQLIVTCPTADDLFDSMVEWSDFVAYYGAPE